MARRVFHGIDHRLGEASWAHIEYLADAMNRSPSACSANKVINNIDGSGLVTLLS
jgi:hypothetical protein